MSYSQDVAKKRVSRTHFFVEFGRGKSIKICHKCGTIRNKNNGSTDGKTNPTTYEKNGEITLISPECNDINYNS